jgi:hypothetical protein
LSFREESKPFLDEKQMRVLEDLCPPALLYAIFLVIQLGLDASLGMWVTFVIKALVGVASIFVLDVFCGVGLTPVSWFLVATPFIITALGTAISMGTNFDQYIITTVFSHEAMENRGAKDILDPPGASNSVEYQAQPA